MLKTKFWTPDETWVKPHQSCGVIAVFNTQELLFQLLTKVKEKLLLISLPVSQGKSPKFAYFMLETSSFKKTFEVPNIMFISQFCPISILFFQWLKSSIFSNFNLAQFCFIFSIQFCTIFNFVQFSTVQFPIFLISISSICITWSCFIIQKY